MSRDLSSGDSGSTGWKVFMGVLRLNTKAGFSSGRISNTICEFYFVWYKRPLKDSKDGSDMHRKGRRLGDRTII